MRNYLMMNEIQGKLFVFTAPSGSGKTTIVRHLLAKYPFLSFSVSATTRGKRTHETEGNDYYFMSAEAFQHAIKESQFVEWEEVYTNQYYGTLKSEITRILSSGNSVIFDIDVRGAMQIKKIYGDQCMTVFVKLPDLSLLRERLTKRATESPESLARRLNKAEVESTYENYFDFVLVNDKLDIAFMEAEHIIETFVFGPQGHWDGKE